MQTEIQKQLRTMPGQEKMLQEYYQKNPSALASLKGSLYEEKIIRMIKDKSKATKIEITQVEAQKLLKEENEKNAEEQSQKFKDIDTNIKKVKNSLKTKKPKKTSKKSLSTKAKSKKVSKK
jgi:trigger factor